jgi:tetratricopeptide (TPR) repeat protein
VKGLPITRFCDEQKLQVGERLRLLLPVCRAIQHAHQKGIIHRDIKPSNVLISLYDGTPTPKVIDFGVAKAIERPLTDKTIFTQFGQILGTPEYMSPEQAEMNQLDVDTRSDVYALGCLMYELLTGSTPLDRERLRSAAFDRMLRMLREEEPPRPSVRLSSAETAASVSAQRAIDPKRLSQLVRGDLDWVTMRALEKDRSRRYATANELAADIERYLNHEPVNAGPPTAAYRLRKFGRKYRTALATAGVFTGLLVLATVVSTWQAVRATRAETEANEQRDDAVRQRQRADEEAAIANAVHAFLQTDLLAQANPYKQAEPGHELTLRAALDLAADRVGGRFEKQSLVEAALRQTIGEAYHSLGEYEKSQNHLQRALEIRRRELGASDLETLTSAYNLARVLWRQGTKSSPEKFAQAEPLFVQALEGRRKALGDEHRDTLTAVHGLAALYRATGRLELAEPLFLRNLKLQRQMLGDEHFDTLETLNSLGVLYSQQGNSQQAETFMTQAFENRRKALGSKHPETLRSANNLGVFYATQKKYAQAEALLAETLEFQRTALGGEHPWTLETVRDLLALAQEYSNAGRFADAVRCFETVRDEQIARLGADHVDTLNTLNGLGVAHWRAQQYEKSVPIFETILKARRVKPGDHDPQTFMAAFNLGVNYRDAGRLPEAIALLEEWVGRCHETLGAESSHLEFARDVLAETYERANDFLNAEALIRENAELARKKSGADSPAYASHLAHLAWNLLFQKRHAEAEPLLRECLAIREKKMPESWAMFSSVSMLGETLAGQKKYADAEPLLLRGYEGLKARKNAIPPHYKDRFTQALKRLTQLYDDWGKPDEATKWRELLEEEK